MNKDRIRELKANMNTKEGHREIAKLRASGVLSEWELRQLYKVDSDDAGIIEKVNDLNIEK